MKEKTFKENLYDSLLYGDEWKNLTPFEKALRTLFFCLIIPIPMMFLGQLANENIIEEAEKKRKKVWQYRRDLAENNFYKLIKDEGKKEETEKNAKTQARSKGFLDQSDKATKKGKKINLKDNLLCISKWKELNKKEKVLRVIPIIFTATLFSISLYSWQKSPDKISKVLYSLIIIFSVTFLTTILVSHFTNEEKRKHAQELGISTTAMGVVIDEVNKDLNRQI
ncbi:MAG: hypothetical protein HRK26_00725 [Rickettsiaceae bacterium H1]|nr:hypothetical protein [Rickettsiaceae bacterium H1]